jgi:hypothetical protein
MRHVDGVGVSARTGTTCGAVESTYLQASKSQDEYIVLPFSILMYS